jgi:hypothetical protein
VMKRLLLLAAFSSAVLAVGFTLVPAASGAVPCRDRIFNDWYHDGRVASSYPTSCYRDALKHIPADAKIYSSLASDIKSAMLASLRRQHGKAAPKEVGHGLKAVSQVVVDGQLVSAADARQRPSSAQSLGDPPANATSSGPVADTADSGTPLPILVLGGLALALAAAGAVGTAARYVRRRD